MQAFVVFDGSAELTLAVLRAAHEEGLLAWSIGAVCKDLATGDYVVSLTRGVVSPALVPLLAFLSAGVIAFATGTSYGTMAILVPILIIAYLAFAPEDVVYLFPKPLAPSDFEFSTETMSTFVNATGTLDALYMSIRVALIALVLALLIGAPAGYALARHVFRGRDTYQLGIVATRAFPVVILAVLMFNFVGDGLRDAADPYVT